MVQIWKIVGGADSGGIVVREGRELVAPKLCKRLCTGALVEEVELVDGRLHFSLLSGDGPREGWVSVAMKGRALARNVPMGTIEQMREACRTSGIEPLPAATPEDLLRALAEMGVSTWCDPPVPKSISATSEQRPVMASPRQLDLVEAVGEANGMTPESVCHEQGPTLAVDDSETYRGTWVGVVPSFDAHKTDPYQMFGIPYDATDATIKSVFRKMSLKVHPDRCPGDSQAAARFQQLALAKEFLLDPYQRRAFNEAHGFLTPTLNVEWWSDWNEIFSEIEPEEADTRVANSSSREKTGMPNQITNSSRFDLLIFGATGITGTLACMLMQKRSQLGDVCRTWAIAGRDGRKLQLLKHKFGNVPSFRGAFRVETRTDLERAVRTARVVLDFSGPSHEVGTVVAESCIKAGTHLIDNTGDIMFSRRVKDTLHDKAVAAGVCLVLHTGWASTPTDFGVWKLVNEVRERIGMTTRRVDIFTYTQGFVMSGTSLLTGTQTTAKDLVNAGGPFVLGGVRAGGARKEDIDYGPHKHETIGMIAYPGLRIDKAVVRATCGLMDVIAPYGPNFLCKDWFLVVDKAREDMTKQELAQSDRLSGIGVSLGGGQSLMVEQKKIPPPGWGPKERIRQETFVTKVFVAEADEEFADLPSKSHCILNAGPGNIGDRYEGTAAMMIEAGHCILDTLLEPPSKVRPGWGTPVAHLAHLGFFDRLISLGFSYQFVDGAPTREVMQRIFSATLPITV